MKLNRNSILFGWMAILLTGFKVSAAPSSYYAEAVDL